MAQRISVVGGKPTWQRGLVAMLADLGYGSVSFPDLGAWRPGRGGRAVVMFIASDQEIDELVDFSAEYPHIPVVAVVPGLDLSSFSEVVRAGARGAVDDSDGESELAEVISSAIADRVSVALPIVRGMAQRIPPPNEVDAIVDDTEAGWLRSLGGGETVAALADRIGYSERETYRLLGALYEKIGVTNRTEAIIWATRHGLLDPAAR